MCLFLEFVRSAGSHPVSPSSYLPKTLDAICKRPIKRDIPVKPNIPVNSGDEGFRAINGDRPKSSVIELSVKAGN